MVGTVEDGIRLSTRSTGSRIHVGDVLDGSFSDVGSAGSHREMAGDKGSIGVLADPTTVDTRPSAVVDRIVSARLVSELDPAAETGREADVDGDGG